MKYWVCGHTEEEAKEKAAARFKVSKDKISLKWGKMITVNENCNCSYMVL